MKPEFEAQFQKAYGRGFSKKAPDFARCAANVHDGGMSFGSHQCRRKNGHGPHGAWCKTHDPVARKAKSDAKYAAHVAKRNAAAAERWLLAEAVSAVKAIAAGCNDPRTLAQSVLDGHEERKAAKQ